MSGVAPALAAAPVAGLPGWSAAVVLWAFALGYWDIQWRRLPNAMTLGAALAGLASWGFTGASSLGATGMSMLMGAALALMLTLPGYFFRQLGGGDVKLLLAVAVLGGVQATLTTFVVGALAAVGWLVLSLRIGLPTTGRRLPFGAALALGFAVAVIFGQTGDLAWLR